MADVSPLRRMLKETVDWPRLHRVITRIIPEYATRLLELQNGTNDLLIGIEKHDLEHLAENYPQIQLIRSEAESMQYIGWNTQDPHFADPNVRRAMTLAIDREDLIAKLFTVGEDSYAQPCVGTVGPNLKGWHNDDLVPLPRDLDQARALLKAAGWADADGNGILDKNGESFTVTVIVQNGYLMLKNLAIAIQAQLKLVGVDLQIQLLEPNRFSQVAREHDFEVILWSFGNNPKVDPYIQWHSEGQYNWMQYSDPATDALLEGARVEENIEEAQRMVREAQARIFEANPATFLFWEDEVHGIHERFQGVTMNTFTFLEDVETWWVPTEWQKY
jgi:peptide/nickel transport system substrate-binding protein